MTPAAIALVAIAAIFTMISSVISGVMLFRIEARANRERERDAKITQMVGDVRSLREGMSEGARLAIATLAEETRERVRAAAEEAHQRAVQLAGRLDTVESATEEDREKLITVRERVATLDRTVEGHIRTPAPQAHPPGWGPPVPT